MLTISFQCFGIIVLCAYAVMCDAFWWRSQTTESPPLKQIPLGYFRTFTYHPISYPHTFENYPYGWAPKPYAQPLMDSFKYDSTRVQQQQVAAESLTTSTSSTSAPTTTTTSTAAPSTTSTTTTTTTTAATTTTPAAATTAEPPIVPLVNSASNFISRYSSEYNSPTILQADFYNRQAQPQPQPINYYKPSSASVSGMPSYVVHQPMPGSPRQQVQFVPCMCPVSVGMHAGYVENRSAVEQTDEANLPEEDNKNEEEIATSTDEDDSVGETTAS